nr:MAG TPA: hypothetical protein [Caudoviricetes sp.]
MIYYYFLLLSIDLSITLRSHSCLILAAAW